MTVLAMVSLFLAILPTLVYLRNRSLFRPPGPPGPRSAVSVLIPARNEASGIAACLQSVLANEGVELELIVLDDASTDGTADVARAVDPRVRVEPAPPLPPGWAGKQHACYTLSRLARHDRFTFLDADVRLTPDALARMIAFQQTSRASLVSGFPRQETGTLLERLLLPLINWLLVCYLPISVMRRKHHASLGAGCGQWFLTTREAYEQVGGHSHPMVRGSFHDGVTLPRAYRQAGLMTDLCDATELATCRMYCSAGAVWRGLAKNAREGMAGPIGIWVWTILLFGGQILPWVVLLMTRWEEHRVASWLVLAAGLLGLCIRVDCARWFRSSQPVALVHPVSILLLLTIQWDAVVRCWLGRPVGWKGRPNRCDRRYTSRSSPAA